MSGLPIGELVASRLRDVPDFPEPGVVFKDISPLLADPQAFRAVTQALCAPYAEGGLDLVAGVEARGFVVAAAMAYHLGVGMVPVRKAGKLPGATHGISYDLEYGSARIEIPEGAFAGGERVLVVDDILATGGTAEAACRLVEESGGQVRGVAVILDLGFLPWRARLSGREVHSLLSV